MICLWKHIVFNKEFIKKRRPEKRRFSEILERSRLQASSISPSREGLCLPETLKKTVPARKLFIIADHQNIGSRCRIAGKLFIIASHQNIAGATLHSMGASRLAQQLFFVVIMHGFQCRHDHTSKLLDDHPGNVLWLGCARRPSESLRHPKLHGEKRPPLQVMLNGESPQPLSLQFQALGPPCSWQLTQH